MSACYLAVDIGASSGRHILGYLEKGKMKIEEVYRFENGMKKKDGKLLWDTEELFAEILNGMKRCKTLGKIPTSMSIDTWAVDYVLLDQEDRILGDTFGYRDSRTAGMDEEVYQKISSKELYERTGIQKQIFNTIYQLMAVKKETPRLLSRARTLLMLPDYFQFLLTGKKSAEYTNATSTQLMEPESRTWSRELLLKLGYPKELFLPIQMPGTVLGNLRPEIKEIVGYDLQVVLCASHDTASAVMAMPKAEGRGLYVSSGTWSLMGMESEHALISEEGRNANFTNEGGYGCRFCYLKNIMGLWMIQSVRNEWNQAYSFEELCQMAEECGDFPSRVNVNDDCFLAPESMIGEVKEYCAKSGQPVPETPGEISGVIYQSLAECYRDTVTELERLSGESFDSIYIIGGGANAAYLNQLTADMTGKTVYAGPVEATAIGNLMAQMIAGGVFKGLSEARTCVKNSFEIRTYQANR